MLGTLALLFATSTLCQAVEVPVTETVTERRLLGCGEGFPDNLLWHLDRADSVDGTLDGKLTRTFTGRGSVIYVVDTGVMAAHDEFTRAPGSNVIGGIQLSTIEECPDQPTSPCWSGTAQLLVYGHGTGVASVAAGRTVGIAPDAVIVSAMRAETSTPFRETLLRIIEHAYAPATPPFRTAVVNISASLLPGTNDAELDALLRRMTTGVDAHGNADPDGKRFLIVAAAGNSAPDRNTQCGTNDAVAIYPAVLGRSTPGIITVGGITRDNRYWEGACKGDGVELAAPAADMFVASIGAHDTYRFKPEFFSSGTSWSAPYVSGIAALYLERDRNLSPAQLETILASSPSRVEGIPVPLMPMRGTQNRRRAARH
jgi:serine protease